MYLIGEKHYDEYKIKEKYSWKIEKYDQKIKTEEKPNKVKKLQEKKAKLIVKEQLVLKEGNWLMRSMGDAPAIYDSTLANQDHNQLKLFYFSNGHFQSEVKTDSTIKRRKIKLTYNITENSPHIFNKHQFESSDPSILKLLKKHVKSSYIKKGAKYSENKISNERERIFKLLKDHGYYDFQRQQISFEVDSALGNKKVNVYTYIESQLGEPNQSFTIGKVYFLLDVNNSNDTDSILHENIQYIIPKGEKTTFKILSSNIKIIPGDKYSISKTQQTQQKLGNIDIFKFVNITFQKSDSTTLNAFIHANSMKKYQITTEAGANLNISQGQGLPGPFVNVSFKDRKVFNGFEILDISARYSIDAQVNLTDQQKLFKSSEWGINSSLWFPKLLFPGKFKYQFNNLYPKTRLQLGYTNAERVEYHRETINLSGNYELQNRKNQRIIFTPIDINIINTTNQSDVFQYTLDTLSNNLKASLIPSIIETMSLSYTFNNNDLTKNKKSYYIHLFAESGGQTFKFLHNSSNVGQEDLVFGLPYYQFYKLNSELRYYKPITKYSNLVFRVNTGIAKPYGLSEVLPYEKFFFSGGLNSNRAWSTRRLGPGTFLNYTGDGDDYKFEQQGEIIIESNLEYRGKIGGFLHGAAFIDVGNVWLVNKDEDRPGAELNSHHIWKQFAVGTGLGLRFDFSFLIFRFDVGEKLWDPGRQQFISFTDQYAREYNIGIGYPF